MRTDKQALGTSIQVRIRNTASKDMTLYIEPWGDQYTMAPGAIFRVIASGPQGDCLELEYGEAEITVYGWPGSVISVDQLT